ncbi:MAG: type II secretion system GspH family protein [Oscillospiraceae bacterium]|nr:type II secretion system GspH family protein [Oscillospiraceae bacterium]
MKRKLKGFTLIECLIALAILGIASLTMAQVYAGVAKRNLKNRQSNVSIANQEEFIEKELKDNGALEIQYNGYSSSSSPTPPHLAGETNQATTSYVYVEDSSGNSFSYPVDIYILFSRDADNHGSDDTDYNGPSETQLNLNYRYFLSH